MTGVSIALISGTLLLILLLLFARKGGIAVRGLPVRSYVPPDDDEAALETCPPEFVPKIFSQEDSEFVSKLESPHLGQLFRKERKQVALLWVRQTSAGIRRIMREHAEVARRSSDLEFRTELKVFLQYSELTLVCGILLAAIQLAGPVQVRGLALHASRLSRSIADAQEAFKAAAAGREMPGLGAS